MRAVKKVKRYIEKNPQDQTSRIFSKLIFALVEETDFSVKELYSLESQDFQLAIELLQEWRLDRYYLGKAKVFDLAFQTIHDN